MIAVPFGEHVVPVSGARNAEQFVPLDVIGPSCARGLDCRVSSLFVSCHLRIVFASIPHVKRKLAGRTEILRTLARRVSEEARRLKLSRTFGTRCHSA